MSTRLRPGMWGYADTCQSIGEHQGDVERVQTIYGPVNVWTCCEEEEDAT